MLLGASFSLFLFATNGGDSISTRALEKTPALAPRSLRHRQTPGAWQGCVCAHTWVCKGVRVCVQSSAWGSCAWFLCTPRLQSAGAAPVQVLLPCRCRSCPQGDFGFRPAGTCCPFPPRLLHLESFLPASPPSSSSCSAKLGSTLCTLDTFGTRSRWHRPAQAAPTLPVPCWGGCGLGSGAMGAGCSESRISRRLMMGSKGWSRWQPSDSLISAELCRNFGPSAGWQS